MSLRRVIVPSLTLADCVSGQILVLPDEFGHYLHRVLRLQKKDMFELCDGKEHRWSARICEIERASFSVALCEQLPSASQLFPLYLAQALPKADKFENILQRATELGVSGVFPFFGTRSVVKLSPQKIPKKMERWERILQESTRQSERSFLPSLGSPQRLRELLKEIPSHLTGLVCAAREDSLDLHTWIDDNRDAKGIILFIGPEGGFTEEELGLLEDAGYSSVGLGPLILRTETAGPAVLAVLQFHFGSFGRCV